MGLKRVVFFGNERIATGVNTNLPVLNWLIAAGYEISAIVVNNTFSNSRNKRQLEVANFAKTNNIPLLIPGRLRDIEGLLANYNAQIGVLVAYGKMVPDSIISLFPGGIVNIHPSLLPLHRGPTPIESVILDGSDKTGVSIMRLAKEMDAGPIYAQQTIGLHGKETKQELADSLLNIGVKLLQTALPSIINGTIEPIAQDNSQATYDNLIMKNDGQINWSKSAQDIERQVRAYATWPRSQAKLDNIDIVITQCDVVNNTTLKPGQIAIKKHDLVIGCGKDAINIASLIPKDKKEMSAAAFLNGYRNLLKIG